jgi:hypothetical protein
LDQRIRKKFSGIKCLINLLSDSRVFDQSETVEVIFIVFDDEVAGLESVHGGLDSNAIKGLEVPNEKHLL